MGPKVAAFMGEVECKKYPKKVLNSMTKEQKMKVRKLQEQQGIKTTMPQNKMLEIMFLEPNLR